MADVSWATDICSWKDIFELWGDYLFNVKLKYILLADGKKGRIRSSTTMINQLCCNDDNSMWQNRHFLDTHIYAYICFASKCKNYIYTYSLYVCAYVSYVCLSIFMLYLLSITEYTSVARFLQLRVASNICEQTGCRGGEAAAPASSKGTPCERKASSTVAWRARRGRQLAGGSAEPCGPCQWRPDVDTSV